MSAGRKSGKTSRGRPISDGVDALASSIKTVLRQFAAVEATARELGIFTGDRELLACPKCGLMEDVLISGQLVTFHEKSNGQDYSLEHVYKLFPDGGWREFLEAAHLKVDFHTTPIPDEILLEEFHRVAREIGAIPTGRQVDDRSDYSFAVYKERFGGIQNTLKRYRAWLEKNHPDAPELGLVDAKSKHEVITPKSPTPVLPGSQQWDKTAHRVGGPWKIGSSGET